MRFAGIRRYVFSNEEGVMDNDVSQVAEAGDRLVTTGSARRNSCGFARVGEPDVAVSLIPGTELAFDKVIQYRRRFSVLRFCGGHRVAEFRHFRCRDPDVSYDAIELPNGRIIMVAQLTGGQTATVERVPSALQPAAAATTTASH
jgi:hypothetical protein